MGLGRCPKPRRSRMLQQKKNSSFPLLQGTRNTILVLMLNVHHA